MDFTHLHLHTEFSLLDGAARIDDCLKRAADLNMHSIAITDHGVMYGVIDFYRAAVSIGIKPIIGCEFYVAPGNLSDKTKEMKEYSHLVLLAKNKAGYQNLMRLSSIGFIEGFYHKPRIDYDVLEKHKEGLICLSACLAGDIPRLILSGDYAGAKNLAARLRNVFGQDFYLELQDHYLREQKSVNASLIKLGKELSVPLVATNDVHYTMREDAKAQDVLLCIQTRSFIDETERLKFETDEFYLKSADEMAALFLHVPEAISNTNAIAEKCDLCIDFSERHLPVFAAPKEYDNVSYLKKVSLKGLESRYKKVTQDLTDRLLYELSVIEDMGFTDYFLIVWDFIRFARESGITVGPGRGSAAGSLAAYALSITDVDPIAYSLLFERFLNPERISMPDIDIDFCIERRGEVIDYVVQKYGADKVAQIITFGTLGAKQVIRDVARAMRVPLSDADRIAKMVPFAPKMTIKRAMQENPQLMIEYQSRAQIRELIDTALKLEGIPRHASTHAAGVVISRSPITEHVPLATNPRDNSVITQFPMNTLESLGLLKMDFLGLRNLTVIRHALEEIEKTTAKKIDIFGLKFDDPKVFELISSGDTDGIFQLESAGMRSLMQRLKPTSLNDIMVGISLYRPGPMESIPAYLSAKENPDNVGYLHPKLKRILKETYGCMVYQEQVMEIVRDLAGYSLARSDIVRRAMGKKKKDIMENERRIFIYGDEKIGVEGAVKRGVPAKTAEKIFSQMADFAEYAFNKSHACAYAAIAYYTAYLKCHYKVEYLTALLNSLIGSADKISAYIQYCTSSGIKMYMPDINSSQFLFAPEGEGIRFGFAAIRDVGKVAQDIVTERENGKFLSFRNFINRTAKIVNKKMLEGLILAGCFDSLGIARSTLMSVYDRVLKAAQDARRKDLDGQLSLFDSMPSHFSQDADDFDTIPEFKRDRLLAFEKLSTGVYLSGHPLDKIKNHLEAMQVNVYKILASKEDVDSARYFESRNVELIGILSGVKRRSTKQKKLMANAFLEDLSGLIEIVIFPSVFIKTEHILADDAIVCVSGKVDIREGEAPQLLVDSVRPFIQPDEKFAGKKLYVRIPKSMGEDSTLLKHILSSFPGNTKPTVTFEKTGCSFKASGSLAVSLTDGLIQKLKESLGDENIIVQ